LSTPNVKKAYDLSPYKRAELRATEVSTLVKAPLKQEGNLMLESPKGGNDIAIYSLEEVIEKLNLTAYAQEILDEMKRA